MKNTKVVWGLLVLMCVAPLGLAAAAEREPDPKKALAINDSNVTTNGIRVRLTETAIRYLRVTIRDLLASYDSKGGSGMNLLLDPGYDPVSHSAGPVRTTAVEPKWAWSGGTYQWIQTRKWGTNGSYCNADNTVGGNQRGVPAALQDLNREQGFYVLTTEGQCHDQFNFCNYHYCNAACTPSWIETPHVGYDAAASCSLDPISLVGDPSSGNYVQVFLNIGLFIFPTMYMENQPDPMDGWDPPDLGPYTGGGGAPGVTTRSLNGWTAATPPANAGTYVPGNAYSMDTGTYFRSGDDAAMYLNYYQMQVQSVNRASFRPSGCGVDYVYTGTHDANHEPIYFGATVPQCLRAKSYWKGESNVNPNIKLDTAKGEIPHWEPCHAYDTYRLDGTLNPARDDDEGIYPGAPNDGAGPTCGAATDLWTAGSAGWYGLEIKSFVINPETAGANKNTIALSLSAPELRLEYGLWVDAWASGELLWIPTQIAIQRLWTIGYAASTRIDAMAKLKLESIDDQSCVPGLSASCTGFYHPYNDNKVLPDKFLINILMDPATDFQLQPLSFNGPSTCIIDFGVLGCVLDFATVLNLIKGMITDVVEAQLAPVILDLLADITGIVPNLSSILGDPWNFGTGLIEYGLFMAGDQSQSDGGNPPRWPVRFFNGPGGAGGTDKVGDIRMGVGFKPVAFRPPNAANSNIMQVDPNDPPCKASDPRAGCTSLPNPTLASVYGVPKLIEPDTSTCVQANTGSYAVGVAGYRKRATGTYTYSQSTGKIVFTFTTGAGADLRVGDIVYDVTKNQGLPLMSLEPGGGAGNVGAGQNSIMDGGAFEIREGTVLGITGMTAAQMGAISPTMTFLDTTTNKRGVITEVVGAATPATAKIFLAEDYNAASFDGGTFKILNCSAANTFPTPDADGVYDADATVVAGTFNDTKGGVSYTASQVIREYWQGPIDKFKAPPAWCVTPNALRTGATGNDFAYLYPQKTWLSFHSTADINPLGQTTPRNTFGGWDKMDANTVLKQNVNTGAKDAAQIPYDLSIHIHQRTFASLMQAMVASGITCLDFSTVDTDGSSTPWAGMLNVGAFNSFLPGIASMFPASMTVSVHISPYVTPHLRTGVGRLSFMPRERLRDPSGGPLPISNERYTFGIALPDLKIEVVANDKVPVTLLTAYWSTTFGFYTKAVRACYKLDPLRNAIDCTSTQVNERTVSGYSEFFADLNSDSLAREFENGRDGFTVGQFSNRDIGTTRGESSFVITQSVCDLMPTKCNVIGLSQAVPMLLNSLVQMFFVTRFSFMNFTLDTLYMGPDGPNDDGIGGGDYIGIYARMMGGLDVFGLLGAMGGSGISLAPGMFDPRFQPSATLTGLAQDTYINTNAPTFDVKLETPPAFNDGVKSYSYQVDDGFWHTPIEDPKLEIKGLLEGKHKIALKAYTDTLDGAYGQFAPTVLTFTVDTLPPEVTIHPSKQGFFTSRVPFSATDLQATRENMTYEYSFDDGKWAATEEDSISLSGLKAGRHTLRVRATDLAGNVGSAAREIVVDPSGCGGCASSGAGDVTWVLVVVSLLAIRFGRRRSV